MSHLKLSSTKLMTWITQNAFLTIFAILLKMQVAGPLFTSQRVLLLTILRSTLAIKKATVVRSPNLPSNKLVVTL